MTTKRGATQKAPTSKFRPMHIAPLSYMRCILTDYEVPSGACGACGRDAVAVYEIEAKFLALGATEYRFLAECGHWNIAKLRDPKETPNPTKP